MVRYTFSQLEAALCFQEAMHDELNKPRKTALSVGEPRWIVFTEAQGAFGTRQAVADIAVHMDAAWHAITDEFGAAISAAEYVEFDWEFVPFYLRAITWSADNYILPSQGSVQAWFEDRT